MADYFTRVELHSGKSADYEKLHEEMAKRGFYRAIKDGAGNTWQLPTAEYHKISAESVSAVRDEARSAANSTSLKNIVLTMQVSTWAGYFDPN